VDVSRDSQKFFRSPIYIGRIARSSLVFFAIAQLSCLLIWLRMKKRNLYAMLHIIRLLVCYFLLYYCSFISANVLQFGEKGSVYLVTVTVRL